MRELNMLTSENVDKEMLEMIERCERIQKECEAAKAEREARIYAEDIEVIYEYGGKRKHLVRYVERDITNPEYKQRTCEFFRNRKEMERYVKELKEKAERMKRIAQENEEGKENSVEEENVVESNCGNEKGQENMENNSQEDTPCLEENNETKSNINLNKNVMKKSLQNESPKTGNNEVKEQARTKEWYADNLKKAKDEWHRRAEEHGVEDYQIVNLGYNDWVIVDDMESFDSKESVCEANGDFVSIRDREEKQRLTYLANVIEAWTKELRKFENEDIQLGTLDYNGWCDARLMFNPENCTMSMVDENDNVFFSITHFPEYRAQLMMEHDEMTSEMVGKYISMYYATSDKYMFQQHEWYDDINELYDYMINYLEREEANEKKSEKVLRKLTTYFKDSDISISSEKTDFGCLIRLYSKKDGDCLNQLEVHDCGYGRGYVMDKGWQGKKAVDKFNECTAMLSEETMDMIGSTMMGF